MVISFTPKVPSGGNLSVERFPPEPISANLSLL